MIKYYDNEEKSTKVVFIPAGRDRNGKTVYHKMVTVFSIAEGLLQEFTIPVKCYHR